MIVFAEYSLIHVMMVGWEGGDRGTRVRGNYMALTFLLWCAWGRGGEAGGGGGGGFIDTVRTGRRRSSRGVRGRRPDCCDVRRISDPSPFRPPRSAPAR